MRLLKLQDNCKTSRSAERCGEEHRPTVAPAGCGNPKTMSTVGCDNEVAGQDTKSPSFVSGSLEFVSSGLPESESVSPFELTPRANEDVAPEVRRFADSSDEELAKYSARFEEHNDTNSSAPGAQSPSFVSSMLEFKLRPPSPFELTPRANEDVAPEVRRFADIRAEEEQY